jgi:flagellar biosynthetic protein FliR
MNIAPLLDQALLAALIFLRLATALSVMPIYGFRGVPLTIKAGLAGFMSFLLLPAVHLPAAYLGATPGATPSSLGFLDFVALAAPEVLVGLIVGFIAGFIFYGVEMAGEFISLQMGFSIVTVMDPMTEQQTSIIAQVQYLFATVIFLTFNGHIYLLEGLQQTFAAVPLGGLHFSAGLMTIFLKLSTGLFVAAIKIAAPVMAALFLAEVALGIIARTVPQMNIFLVSLPLKIGLGLLGLALSLPMFAYVLDLLWKNFQVDWRQFITLLGR